MQEGKYILLNNHFTPVVAVMESGNYEGLLFDTKADAFKYIAMHKDQLQDGSYYPMMFNDYITMVNSRKEHENE